MGDGNKGEKVLKGEMNMELKSARQREQIGVGGEDQRRNFTSICE